MNFFERISHDIGGPIVNVISFSNIHDIFPNFMLVCREFSKERVDFALEKLRSTSLSEEEFNFFHNLVESLFFKRGKRLNQDLIIRLIACKIITLDEWFSHPFVNDSLHVFSVFYVFGHKRVVDYIVDQDHEIIRNINKHNYFSNGVSYITKYSTLECFKWFFDFFKIPLTHGYGGAGKALETGNLEIFKYKIEELGLEKCIVKDLKYLSFQQRRRDTDEEQMLETYKFLISKFGGTNLMKNEEKEFLDVCSHMSLIGFFRVIDCIVTSFPTNEKRRKRFLHKLIKHFVSIPIKIQRSKDYFYSNYRKNITDYFKCPLVSAIRFSQLEEVQSFMNEDTPEKIEVKKHHIRMACEEQNFEIFKLLLSKYIDIEPEFSTSIFDQALRNGHFEMINYLVHDLKFSHDVINDHSLSIYERIRRSLENSNVRTNILLRNKIIEEKDLKIRNNSTSYRNGVTTRNYVYGFNGDNDYYNPYSGDEEDNKEPIFEKYISEHHFRLVKLFMDLKSEEFDPGVNDNEALFQTVTDQFPRVALMLLDDERVDPASKNCRALIQLAEESTPPSPMSEKLFRMLLDDRRVDPSIEDSRILTCVKSVEFVMMLLEDGRVDPSVRNNEFIKLLTTNWYVSGDNYEILDIYKKLLTMKNVDVGVDNNVVLKNLHNSNHRENLEIVKYLNEEHQKKTKTPIMLNGDKYGFLKHSLKVEKKMFVEYYCPGLDFPQSPRGSYGSRIDWKRVKEEVKKMFEDIEFEEDEKDD